MSSLQEAFYRFKQMLGVGSSQLHALNISGGRWATTAYCLATDLENTRHAFASGMDLRSGSIITADAKSFGTGAASYASNVFLDVLPDALLQMH